MSNLEGLVIVITGGSRGIGKLIAKDLFDQGASVLICSRNIQDVNLACKEIDSTGKKVLGIKADVSKMSDCKEFIDFAISKFGKIDVLINNVGANGEINEFAKTDLLKWVETVEINLFSMIFCTKYALDSMLKNGNGKIINIAGAGVGGKKTMPNFSAYRTSKVAVVGFTENLSSELCGKSIQVNCIAPGAINTNITDYVISQGPEKVGAEMYSNTLKQKESGGDSLEDVKNVIRFLCSQESNHLSGRLISAKWDKLVDLKKTDIKDDLYKLRRIDNDLFYTK